REAVLSALEVRGHRLLVSMLENGEWKLSESELVVGVASSTAVIEMSLGTEARQVIQTTAASLLGRPLRHRVVSSGATPSAPVPVSKPRAGGGRSRAEQDPVVRRMKEKFGAEIRTIIDYREKP